MGLTGKEARVEDEIYILNVYLTKSGNLKVSSNLLIRVQLISMSKVGLRPQQADMKGRVAVRTLTKLGNPAFGPGAQITAK